VRVRLLPPAGQLVEAALSDLVEREKAILRAQRRGTWPIADLLRRLVEPFEDPGRTRAPEGVSRLARPRVPEARCG
jgi:hypothetical protein